MIPADNDCSWLDLECKAENTLANTANKMLTDFAEQLASWYAGLLRGALNADSSIQIFAADNKTGSFANLGLSNQFVFWIAIMVGVIVVVGLVQIIIAIVLGSVRRMLQVALAILSSIPSVYLGTIIMQQMIVFTNTVTDKFIDLIASDKEGGLPHAILVMTGLQTFAVTDPNAGAWVIAGGVGSKAIGGPIFGGSSPLMAILVLGFLLISVAFLAVSMLIRAFGLAVLATLAPIPLMFVGQPKFKSWAKGWAEIVTGMLLAKPLAAAIIGVAVAVSAGGATAAQPSDHTVTDLFGVVAGFVGVFIASASPALTIGLTRWAGNEIQSAIAQRPSLSRGVYKAQMVMGLSRGLGGRASALMSKARSGKSGGRGSSRPGKPGRDGSNGPNGRNTNNRNGRNKERTRETSRPERRGGFYRRQPRSTRGERK